MESEDEDGEELTPGVDAAILRTLAKIKRRDPDIYDQEKAIFEGEPLYLWNGKHFKVSDRGAEKVWEISAVKAKGTKGQGYFIFAPCSHPALILSSLVETHHSPSRETRCRASVYISLPLSRS